MKYIVSLLLFLLTACMYNSEESLYKPDLQGSNKSEIYLYMDQEVVAFLEKEGTTNEEKQYVFDVEAKVVDKAKETVEIKERAEVKIHGESTKKYSRKSLALDLKDDQMYFNFPYETDEFFLISMIEDTGYVGNLIGYSILSDLGLFNNHFEMVHVYFNDIYKGLYLLVEKTQHAIRNNHGGVTTIFRRNYGPNFDFSYSATHLSENEAETERLRLLSIYDAIDEMSGRVFRDTLESLIDVPQYCRWLALNALLRNGDYLDEIFFYQQDVDGSKKFRINAWDYDDLFKPPHWGNDYNNSLIYCNEDPLDVAIGSDTVLYNIFKEEYNYIVNELMTDEYLSQLKMFIAEYLIPEFSSESVAEIMSNFSTNTSTAQKDLKMIIDLRFSEIMFRRDSVRSVLY